MNNNFLLRGYQEEALKSVIESFENGINRQLISLPTGSGKTIVISAVAQYYKTKTLVLAHREELIEQAVEKIKLYSPDADVGICKAKKNEISRKIVVGSIQSCMQDKRLKALKKSGIKVLIIDEAHHAPSSSYRKIIEYLGFFDGPKKLLLGVTATPKRNDKKGLDEVFEKITFERSVGTLIKGGYLSPVVGRRILTSFRLKGIKTKMGDFVVSQLAMAVNIPERNAFIFHKWKVHANNRKTLIFCVDVKHCKDMAAFFSSQGIVAKAVWGLMDSKDRKETLIAFRNNEIQVIISCSLLTEGFDDPSVDCIVMARPTKSKPLYTQMVGRGLRKYMGKQDCLVLDFTDQQNNIDQLASLSASIPEATMLEDGTQSGQRNPNPRNPSIRSDKDLDQEFDILGSVKLRWVKLYRGEWCLIDARGNELLIRPKENGYIADLISSTGNKIKSIVVSPISLDYCVGVCEDFARSHMDVSLSKLDAPWLKKQDPATKSQLDVLKKFGVKPINITKAGAYLLINEKVAFSKQERRNKIDW